MPKERVLRLVSALCGSRFGRGVVVPGGVGGLARIEPGVLLAGLDRIEKVIMADAGSLMATSSFLDRLRTTGPLIALRGLRRGEAAGLRWTDLDLALDAGLAYLARPIQHVAGTLTDRPLKTAASRRAVALDPATVAALRPTGTPSSRMPKPAG